jgi:hypothetical protein
VCHKSRTFRPTVGDLLDLSGVAIRKNSTAATITRETESDRAALLRSRYPIPNENSGSRNVKRGIVAGNFRLRFLAGDVTDDESRTKWSPGQ